MLRQWKIHGSAYVTQSVIGNDIVITDCVTGDEVYSKTVPRKYEPFIKDLFLMISECHLHPDVLLRSVKINNTQFTISNYNNCISFNFPRFIRPLIECCYIVASYWGANIEEIGASNMGYQVRFHNVGGWTS